MQRVQVNFDLARPIYTQIVDEVRHAIARGEIAPGDKIPSQREMAQQLKVNPNTVQRAYQEMERMQLVETLRGEGTFVRMDSGLVIKMRNEMAQQTLAAFLQEMITLGFGPAEVKQMVAGALAGRAPDGTPEGPPESRPCRLQDVDSGLGGAC